MSKTYLFVSVLVLFQTVVSSAEIIQQQEDSITSILQTPLTDNYTPIGKYVVPEIIYQDTASNYLTGNNTFYQLTNIVKEGNPQDQSKFESLYGTGVKYDIHFSFSKYGISTAYPLAYANLTHS